VTELPDSYEASLGEIVPLPGGLTEVVREYHLTDVFSIFVSVGCIGSPIDIDTPPFLPSHPFKSNMEIIRKIIEEK
jgi:hypothetical protein